MMAKDIAEDSGQWIEDRGENSGPGSRERKDVTKVRQRVCGFCFGGRGGTSASSKDSSSSVRAASLDIELSGSRAVERVHQTK